MQQYQPVPQVDCVATTTPATSPVPMPQQLPYGVVMVTHQQQAAPAPVMGAMPLADWSTGLLDCMNDTNNCMDTFCCHYCQMGHQYGRLKYGTPTMDAAITFGALAADVLFLGGLARCVLQMDLRQKITMRYSINESPVMNCFKVTFCSLCALCQQYREMKVRGENCGGLCMPGEVRVIYAPQPQSMTKQQI